MLKEDINLPVWTTIDITKSADAASLPVRNAIEATFVDDECLVFVCKSANVLDDIANKAFTIVASVFRQYKLVINLRPGKF